MLLRLRLRNNQMPVVRMLVSFQENADDIFGRQVRRRFGFLVAEHEELIGWIACLVVGVAGLLPGREGADGKAINQWQPVADARPVTAMLGAASSSHGKEADRRVYLSRKRTPRLSGLVEHD